MKAFKRFTALVLALVMAAMLAVSAYAATVVVKYKVYVYTSQLTFKQYDYSSSTTPSTRNLTILADSSLGSGSALYHVKYVDGTVAYPAVPAPTASGRAGAARADTVRLHHRHTQRTF